MTVCKICNSTHIVVFSSITYGIWQDSEIELVRDSEEYPVAQCDACGHVQVSTEYTPEMFHRLYFHSVQAPVMWHESMIGDDSPYQQMYAFASGQNCINSVVDFGCGEGKLLAAAKKADPGARLFGIDFNNRFSQEGITYLSHDLTMLNSLDKSLWPQGIDLAMVSHVLEHVVDPAALLLGIRQHLSERGQIFIEVPDFSDLHSSEMLIKSNLVNLQHIHYFTLDTLHYVTRNAGFEIVEYQQITTGYIPRLLARLLPGDAQAQVESTAPTTKQTILNYDSASKNKRKQLAKQILISLEKHGMVGLWGLGADFYKLIRENSLIASAIGKRKIQLFDYQFQGKTYLDQPIASSSEIGTVNFPVYICPALVETNINMRQVSQHWSNVVKTKMNESEDVSGIPG